MRGVHDEDPVRGAGNILHTVRDKQDRVPARLVVAGNLGEQHIAALRVKARRRLVENEDVRIHRDYAGNRHAALLAAGKLKRAFVVKILRETDKRRRLARTVESVLLREAHISGTEGNIPQHRLLKELVLRILKHHADAEAHLPDFLRLGPDVLSVEEHLA